MTHADPAARLEAVLVAENDALVRHDVAAAAALLDEKIAATAALPTDDLSIGYGQRLRALATENRRLLEQAMQVQGEIVAMVIRAAQPVQAAARYGAEGRTIASEGALAITRQA